MTSNKWNLDAIKYGLATVIGPNLDPVNIGADLLDESSDMRNESFQGNTDVNNDTVQDDDEPIEDSGIVGASSLFPGDEMRVDHPKNSFMICNLVRTILSDIKNDTIPLDCEPEKLLQEWIRLFVLEYKHSSKRYVSANESCTLSMVIFLGVVNIFSVTLLEEDENESEMDLSCLTSIVSCVNRIATISGSSEESALTITKWNQVTLGHLCTMYETIVVMGKVFIDYMSSWCEESGCEKEAPDMVRRLFLLLSYHLLNNENAEAHGGEPNESLFTLSFYYCLLEKYVLSTSLDQWVTLVNDLPIWSLSELPSDFVNDVTPDIVNRCSNVNNVEKNIKMMYDTMERRLLSRVCIREYVSTSNMFSGDNLDEYFDSRTTANNVYITAMIEYQSSSLILPSKLFARIRSIHSDLHSIKSSGDTGPAVQFMKEVVIPILSDCSDYSSENLVQVAELIYGEKSIVNISVHDLQCILSIRQCIIEAFVESIEQGTLSFSVGAEHVSAEVYDSINTRKKQFIRAFRGSSTLIHYSMNRYAVVHLDKIYDCGSDYGKGMALLKYFTRPTRKFSCEETNDDQFEEEASSNTQNKRKRSDRTYKKLSGLRSVTTSAVNIKRLKSEDKPAPTYMSLSGSEVKSANDVHTFLGCIETMNNGRGSKATDKDIDVNGLNSFVFGEQTEEIVGKASSFGNNMFKTIEHFKSGFTIHKKVDFMASKHNGIGLRNIRDTSQKK